MLIPLLLGLFQAVAQSGDSSANGSSAARSAPCSVTNVSAPSGKRADLYLVCGLAAVRLGNADQFSSSYNPSLDAIVVVRQDGGQTNVSLISRTASGQSAHIDDISGEVLRSATGRNSDRGSANVDISSFAANGKIMATAASDDFTSAPATSQLDLTTDLSQPVAAAVQGMAGE